MQIVCTGVGIQVSVHGGKTIIRINTSLQVVCGYLCVIFLKKIFYAIYCFSTKYINIV